MDEEQVTGRSIIRLDNATALRAYAHPVRMKLILALRTRGPLTATQAGRLLGESSGTCSFHLRQLAKYGLVEETGEGTGREKPWRATTTSTGWDDVQETPEATAAAGSTLGGRHFLDRRRWPPGQREFALRAFSDLPPPRLSPARSRCASLAALLDHQ